MTDKKQKLAHARLLERVRLARKHVNGFDAKNGYDLRKVKTWSPQKIKKVTRIAATLRELTRSPHDIKTAATPRSRRNLIQFTQQRIRGAKHFIVHKPSESSKVRLVHGRVEIEGRYAGGVVSRSRFFLLPRRPRVPDDILAMAREMRPEMPRGFYVVLTAAHGDTGAPFERDKLIDHLRDYLVAYEVDAEGASTGFADTIIGFRFMSTSLGGAKAQHQRTDQRRERQKELNRKRQKEWQASLTRKKAMRPKRKKVTRKPKRKVSPKNKGVSKPAARRKGLRARVKGGRKTPARKK